jgi:hypothetical protein
MDCLIIFCDDLLSFGIFITDVFFILFITVFDGALIFVTTLIELLKQFFI